MAQRTQRLIEAARRPLPEGTFVVGAGLLVAGVTTYLFQILSFRSLSKADYAALNALWVSVFVLAPGLLPPARAGGRARASPTGARAASAAVRSSGARPCSDSGSRSALGARGRRRSRSRRTSSTGCSRAAPGSSRCLVIALFSYCFTYLARGTVAGNGRFRPVQHDRRRRGSRPRAPVRRARGRGRDQPGRVRPLHRDPARDRHASRRCAASTGSLAPGPQAPWSELSTNLGYLLGGSLMAQALSYAPFLGAQLLSTPRREARAVADFIVGLFLARIPILLFQAVQAALLPKLAHLAGAGQHDDFQSGLRKLVLVVVGIGVIGVVAAGTIGADRRRDPLRRQVQPRQHRPRAARRRERALHPRPHARAGADRAAWATRRR